MRLPTFIARAFIARTFIARTFIARTFIARCLAAGSLGCFIAGCTVPAATAPPQSSQPKPAMLTPSALGGTWQSVRCEPIGPALSLTRELTLVDDRWDMHATLFSDGACGTRAWAVDVAGRFVLGESSTSGQRVRFERESATITPSSAAAVAQLKKQCPGTGFRAGTASDVSAAGCGRVPSIAGCPAENDIVRLSTDELFLAARDRDLCAEQATEPSSAALRRRTVHFRRLVDLTHTLHPGFPFIQAEGTFAFSMEPIATHDSHGVAANRWNIHEHIGTQIDAPSHFAKGQSDMEGVSVRSLVAPLVVIDISERAEQNADAAVSLEDIRAWEKAHGVIARNAAVFMYSGWEARVNDGASFVNDMHFPGFSLGAAKFLLAERDVVGIGVDTLSIDPGRDKAFAVHRLWLGAGRWAVEMVARLGEVPPAGATVFVGAPKVQGATGGLARIVAMW